MGKTFKRNKSENGFRKFTNDKNFKKSKKFKHLDDATVHDHKKKVDNSVEDGLDEIIDEIV